MLLNFHVAFVADEHKTHFRIAIKFSFLQPPGSVVEGFPVCDVIDDDGPCSGSIVSPGDGFE